MQLRFGNFDGLRFVKELARSCTQFNKNCESFKVRPLHGYMPHYQFGSIHNAASRQISEYSSIGMHFDDTVEAGQPRRRYVLHHNNRNVASNNGGHFAYLAESDGDLCATSLWCTTKFAFVRLGILFLP